MSKPSWEMSSADGSAEDPRTRWFRRRTAILLTVIMATSVWMVAPGGPLIVVAPSSANYIVVALRLASDVEAVVDRGDPVGSRYLSGLRTD